MITTNPEVGKSNPRPNRLAILPHIMLLPENAYPDGIQQNRAFIDIPLKDFGLGFSSRIYLPNVNRVGVFLARIGVTDL